MKVFVALAAVALLAACSSKEESSSDYTLRSTPAPAPAQPLPAHPVNNRG